MPLSASWRTALPDTGFVAPDAPFHSAYGHRWFAVDGDQLRPDRIKEVRAAFDRTVSKVVDHEGFGNAIERVAFVGVSQGAIVGLDAVASGRWKVGALVSFAGLLPPGPISDKSRSTPVLLIHGQADQLIPAFASTLAEAQLEAAGFEVVLDVEPGVGHTISPGGAQKALAFLKKTFVTEAVK
jgi:phospholipase/carboxylesterase